MFEGSVVVLAVRIVVGLEEVVRFPRLLTDWRQTRKKSAPSGGGLAVTTPCSDPGADCAAS
jgi:hypothetical protein